MAPWSKPRKLLMIVLERRKGGAKLVSDVDLVPRRGMRRLLSRFLRHGRAGPKKAA
jgi:putative ATP-binding cassette transporter